MKDFTRSVTALLTLLLPPCEARHQSLEALQDRLREECRVWRSVYLVADSEEARAALRLEFELVDLAGGHVAPERKEHPHPDAEEQDHERLVPPE